MSMVIERGMRTMLGEGGCNVRMVVQFYNTCWYVVSIERMKLSINEFANFSMFLQEQRQSSTYKRRHGQDILGYASSHGPHGQTPARRSEESRSCPAAAG